MQPDGALAFTNPLELAELLNDSTRFSDYRIDADGQTSLSSGDSFTLTEAGLGTVSATYLGTATLTFAAVSDRVGLIDHEIQVAPVSGSLVLSDGRYFLVTDQPIDDDNLRASASVNWRVGAGAARISVEAPISGLADALADELSALPGPIAKGTALWLRHQDRAFCASAHRATASLSHDPDADRELSENEIVCFVTGTLIDTERGPVAIEDLRPGDRIWTRDAGFQPLRWIGSARIGAAHLARHPHLRPIRIRASALAPNVPNRDLLVSPQHRILIRSKIAVKMFGAMEVLVPAKQLLLIEGIDQVEDPAEVVYWHMLFDRHQIVASNGAETESLFTGPQALRSLSGAARAEVLALFPELLDLDYQPQAVRLLPTGRQARRLAQRHAAKRRDLIC